MKKLLLTFALFLIFISQSYAQFNLLREFAGGGSDGMYPFYNNFVISGTTLYGMTARGGDEDVGTIFKIETNGSGFALLHEFAGGVEDGDMPYGSLILSGTTLYGMTRYGGDYNKGTIFKIETNGSGFALLYEFAGVPMGCWPSGSFILSGTTLYGMTPYGGNNDKGTIFKIETNGSGFALLHEFTGGVSDGREPNGDLILSGTTLYGMTRYGGDDDNGTIFKIETNGSGFALLREFAGGGSDGKNPFGSLIFSETTLYGMTYQGGDNDYGTIFKIETNGSGFALLREFAGGGSDGKNPYGSLNLSGTTLYGMTNQGGDVDYGTIFQIETNGTGFALIREFAGGGSDGKIPGSSLILSGTTLYGMTFQGGDNDLGVIFAYSAASSPTVTTTAISNIGSYTATGGGNVTDDGGDEITARGICWNTTGTPTISDSHTTESGTTGIFTSSLTALTPGTFYYVRAYATNSEGTSYGSVETFTTDAATPVPTMTEWALIILGALALVFGVRFVVKMS